MHKIYKVKFTLNALIKINHKRVLLDTEMEHTTESDIFIADENELNQKITKLIKDKTDYMNWSFKGASIIYDKTNDKYLSFVKYLGSKITYKIIKETLPTEYNATALQKLCNGEEWARFLKDPLTF